MLPPALMPPLRVLEALVLASLAGIFVRISGLERLPLLGFAALGFFAGGCATLRTFGYVVRERRRRGWLALLCVTAALSTLHGARYLAFRERAARDLLAEDYRIGAEAARTRVEEALREQSGVGGPLGFLLGEVREGAGFLGIRLRGPAVLTLRLLEVAIALLVGWRWAAGPAAVARPAGAGHG